MTKRKIVEEGDLKANSLLDRLRAIQEFNKESLYHSTKIETDKKKQLNFKYLDAVENQQVADSKGNYCAINMITVDYRIL